MAGIGNDLFDPDVVRGRQREYRERLNAAAGERDVDSDVRKALAYIHEHLFDHDLTAGRACAECGLPDHNFTMLFKEQVGTGMGDYISSVRVEMARELLTDFDIPVMEIGWLVGYAYPETFSRAFRRVEGRTATAFRKAVRGTSR